MAFKPVARFAAALGLFVAAALPAVAAPLSIVGFGDSLMAGYELSPGKSFPEQLEAALKQKGVEVAVTNAGVSGDTSSDGLARLDWSVPDGTGLVLLELGANDMLRGIDPALTRRNLDAMLARLKERGIPVLLIGMRAAPNLGPDYVEKFDAIYPELAQEFDVQLYPFFLDGVAATRSLQLADGMHPTAEAVAKIVERILPAVEKALADRSEGKGTSD